MKLRDVLDKVSIDNYVADEEFEKAKEEAKPYYSFEQREAFELDMESLKRELALLYNIDYA